MQDGVTSGVRSSSVRSATRGAGKEERAAPYRTGDGATRMCTIHAATHLMPRGW